MNDIELISSYLDGTLDEKERTEVLARLENEPQLRAQYGSMKSVKQLLSDRCTAPVDIENDWKQCKNRLDEIDKSSQAERFVSKYAWAMAASLFILVVGTGVANRLNPSRILHASEVNRYAASLTPGLPSTTNSSAIGDRYGLNFGKPALTVSGVASGRINGLPISRIDLQDVRGSMRLVAVQGASNIDGTTPSEDGTFNRCQIAQINAVGWRHGNTALLLIGDRNYSELEEVAHELIR
ncbi:MAG: hypothetical protein JST40_09760 [Armatimonadetes bacterium]|nr:hypothetical protein [Armatimonadota bacterium]